MAMILVTGCNSLLGRYLVEALLKKGETVRGLDMWKDRQLPQEVEFYEGTVTDTELLDEVCDGVNVVFHLMDVEDASYYGRRFMKKINVKGTEILLNACREAGVEKVIFQSTARVYGSPSMLPVRETDKLKPVTAYGKDKKKAEAICMEHMEEEGMNITIFRPTIVTGPGVDEPMILVILYMAMGMGVSNRMYIAGDGDTKYQLVHPVDVVDALLRMINNPETRGKIYNLGSDNVPTQLEQVIKVKEQSKLDCTIKHITPLFTRVLSFLLKPLNIHYLRKDHVHFILNNFMLDCDRAKIELEWYPQKNNVDIMTETIRWYEDEKL